MPFTAAALADGLVPTVQAAIYTCPASTVVYLKSVTLFNKNAVQQTILLYLTRTGTARFWRRFVLEQYESAAVLDHGESVILETGDALEAATTTTNAVDYTVSGIRETP